MDSQGTQAGYLIPRLWKNFQVRKGRELMVNQHNERFLAIGIKGPSYSDQVSISVEPDDSLGYGDMVKIQFGKPVASIFLDLGEAFDLGQRISGAAFRLMREPE